MKAYFQIALYYVSGNNKWRGQKKHSKSLFVKLVWCMGVLGTQVGANVGVSDVCVDVIGVLAVLVRVTVGVPVCVLGVTVCWCTGCILGYLWVYMWVYLK